MNELLYSMIFKRKSFHVFKSYLPLLPEDLAEIEKAFNQFIPLIRNIKVKIQIVSKNETTCKRGEYCILLYSEIKEHYLKNIGYIGAQLDLWLASHNIGVCWYGAGKTERQYDGTCKFVIMLAIQKVSENHFRKDMFRSKRKTLSEIWEGEAYQEIANIVRFAPSACNLQPWFIVSEEKQLNVYKIINTKRGIMPAEKVDYYREIDIGIFLCYLEICMKHEGLVFQKELYGDSNIRSGERQLCANYKILKTWLKGIGEQI